MKMFASSSIAMAIVATVTGVSFAGETITYKDLVSRLTDLERLAGPVVEGEKTSASTSHDRGARYNAEADRYENWSANHDGSGSIRREGSSQVMVDLEGAGVLWRTWSAKAEGGHITIYIDGSEKPIIDKPFQAYFDDLEMDYPGLAMTLSRGRNEYIPISFAKSCKVVVEKGWGRFFHCTHTIFPEGTVVEPFPGFTPDVKAMLTKASDAWLARGSNPYSTGARVSSTKRTLHIAPGKSTDISLSGAGAIRVLKVTPLDLPDDEIEQEDILRALTISIAWDGEQKPSVWSPLGDFFGTAPGLNPYKTLPMGCIDDTYYSYWYMPYEKGAKVVLGNDGKTACKLGVEIETVTLGTGEASKLLRFCSAWHSDDFTGLDVKRFMRVGGDRWPDWPLLVVEGKGRFVGMTEHVWKFGGWWGEGDEKFFVDGEKYPSTVGTGSEDYVGYAWAAIPPFVTFDSGLASVSRLRPDAQEDTSHCRFHVCDDVPFAQSFQGFIETLTSPNCRPVLYDTCVYWYRETGANNPYPAVPLESRLHRRPQRHEQHVAPLTFQIPVPKPLQPGTIEGESMRVVRVGSGKTWIQNMSHFRSGQWSANHHLIWTHGKKGDSVEMEFKVPKGGGQELLVVLTKANDYGIAQLAIDGKNVGKPIDCFDPQVTRTDEISLGTLDLKAGKHVLRATVIGKHNEAKNAFGAGSYIFGIDYLRIKKQ